MKQRIRNILIEASNFPIIHWKGDGRNGFSLEVNGHYFGIARVRGQIGLWHESGAWSPVDPTSEVGEKYGEWYDEDIVKDAGEKNFRDLVKRIAPLEKKQLEKLALEFANEWDANDERETLIGFLE